MNDRRYNWSTDTSDSLAKLLGTATSNIFDLWLDRAGYPVETATGADAANSTLSPTGRRTELWVPEGYENRYAYPLLVWFHDDEQSERIVHQVMPTLSDRNYLGLGLRGDFISGNGFSWSSNVNDRERLKDDTLEIARNMRREYHVHSERVFLAGIGSGADVALEVFLSRPEAYGGVAAFNGSFRTFSNEAVGGLSLEDHRILLARSGVTNLASIATMASVSRKLSERGADVHIETFASEEGSGLSGEALSGLNHWLMGGIFSAV
ncbi:alpha/beta hydrolase [Stratiformator vulcanicus]|uniref:Phospholipase/Carboxylesterase n=1 Tax=Stratiformator vulcanicus TaxID=2527980 RepID=A0A517QWU2_9PLAN|nr:hypothetical protein [Stratiformator vulcanicus]QDT36129.1 hypothetical protein Pan189_04840 [Stratiformator vulcanicus]